MTRSRTQIQSTQYDIVLYYYDRFKHNITYLIARSMYWLFTTTFYGVRFQSYVEHIQPINVSAS